MRKKNLFKELRFQEPPQPPYTALDVKIHAIKQNVREKLTAASWERKSNFMKSKKKLSFIAIAASLILGVTAFAANGIVKGRFGSSSAIPDYKTIPSEEQVVKDIGYKVVLMDSFSNGYVFCDGSIVNNHFTDESGTPIEKFKSVSFRYKKDGDMVYFSQDKYHSETETSGEVIATENGTDIYYNSYTNKTVPVDYTLTEEDKQAEANGELVFSYGSSKVEINEVQSVFWEKDGVRYLLMQINGRLSPQELCNMAKEVF